MNLKHLSDQTLLDQIKALVSKERKILTSVLHHLKEVEPRRLFSDLGYQSLWEYAVKELKYSEGQASRRFNAARLIKEMPMIEEKIASGSLSLSSLSLAQPYFREAKKSEPNKPISREEKLDLITKLENKSARQTQEILVSLNPSLAMPKEKERIITPEISEIRFTMDQDLKEKLEKVKSLLGPQAYGLSLSELISKMADVTTQALEEKKFGKRRVNRKSDLATPPKTEVTPPKPHLADADTRIRRGKNARYISKAVKYQIWLRDQGKCQKCGSYHGLNFDHIKPIALGGDSVEANLRLLCFQYNQRAGFRTFGSPRKSFRV